MKRVLLYFALATALAMAIVAWGCSASNSGNNFGDTGNGGSGAGEGQGQNGSGTQSAGDGTGGCLICNSTVGGSGGGSNAGTIVITPANPSLVVTNGMAPTQAMTATLDGKDVTASVQWLYERPDIGDIMTSKFVPTGLVAGIGKLTATLNKSSGDTNVSVTIKKVVNSAGITPAQIAAFDNPSGPDMSMKVVYPLADTVFPLGVLAPDVQWNGGGASDFYKLSLNEKYYQYTEYFNTPTPPHHLVSEVDWKSIEESGSGPNTDPLKFSLSRMAAAQAFQPATMTLHVAQGRLHGSVYYWELPEANNNQCGNQELGRILRIKPDSPAVDQFFAPQDCYGCHTVSRDGKTMAAAFSVGVPFPQQTIDLTANPAVLGSLQMMQGAAGTFMAFNDHGDKLLASNDADSNPGTEVLRILNAANGQVLNPSALGSGCGEPAWSPNGKQIAGICGLTGFGWIFDATTGHLVVADVAADGITVSNAKPIVPQAPGNGRPAYPTFSPDSAYIAYGRPTVGSRSTGPGDLWLVKADGSVNKQLAAASTGNNSYNPVFAPLRAGGFYWLVYISRRDYGNQLVNQDRQQIWVTAIDDPPSAADPSHPPFYMRGQENCAKSENAYYALDPCKAIGQDCISGIDCCNGQCVKDPNTNKYVCGTPPPPGMCSGNGNACKVTSDCCNAPEVECLDGFCQVPPPK